MQVKQTIQELKQYGFDRGCRNSMSSWLCVVVNDLQEIMLAVFKDHINAFLLQDDFDQVDQIWMVKLST